MQPPCDGAAHVVEPVGARVASHGFLFSSNPGDSRPALVSDGSVVLAAGATEPQRYRN